MYTLQLIEVFLNSTDHCVANPQEGYNTANIFPSTIWVHESLLLHCSKATHVDRCLSYACCSPSVHGSIGGLQVLQTSNQGFRMPLIPLRVRRWLTVHCQRPRGLEISRMLTVSVSLIILDEQHACANRNDKAKWHCVLRDLQISGEHDSHHFSFVCVVYASRRRRRRSISLHF